MAEIEIYEDITQGLAKDIRHKLSKIPDGEPIELHIASYGGELFSAITIIENLKKKNSRLVAYIDGFACSAASIIAISCDYVKMSVLGTLMIHSAHDGMGNTDDPGVEWCNSRQLMIIKAKNPELGEELFVGDNFLGADEALKLGLVDEIINFDSGLEAVCKRYAASIQKRQNPQEDIVMAKNVIKAAEEMPVEEVVEQVKEKEEEKVEEKPEEKRDLYDVVEELTNRLREIEERLSRLEKPEEVVVEAACGEDDERKQARIDAMLKNLARPQASLPIAKKENVQAVHKVDTKKFAAFLNG